MPLFGLNVISKKSTTFELVSMSLANPTSLNILMTFLRVQSICCPFTLRRIKSIKKSILVAKEHHHIPDEDVRIIHHCRKSLLFHENEPWKEKKKERCFDVKMGSYDGAEICELVGTYILTRLATIFKKSDCGL